MAETCQQKPRKISSPIQSLSTRQKVGNLKPEHFGKLG
jgi:hypothetical protein